MAYFAELDQNNIVQRVIAVGDWVTVDEFGSEIEQRGIDFCKQLFGQETIWKQTSYNTYAGEHINGKIPFRKNYAEVSGTYDVQRNAFIPPKPEGEGWTLDEEKCVWRNLELETEQATIRQATIIGVTRV